MNNIPNILQKAFSIILTRVIDEFRDIEQLTQITPEISITKTRPSILRFNPDNDRDIMYLLHTTDEGITAKVYRFDYLDRDYHFSPYEKISTYVLYQLFRKLSNRYHNKADIVSKFERRFVW